MSKDIETAAPYKTEAMYRFVQVLDVMGFRNGKTYPVRLLKVTSGHDDTVRVELSTVVGETTYIGEMVLKTYDEQWQLYCAASYIRSGVDFFEPEDLKERWDIHYDYNEQVLSVKRSWKGNPDDEFRFDFAPVRATKTKRSLSG